MPVCGLPIRPVLVSVPLTLLLDICINNRYRISHRIGKGGYGMVYSATDLQSNEEVAVKLMNTYKTSVHSNVFQDEREINNTLKGGIGIPRVRWSGYQCEFAVFVMDALGPSLHDLFLFCGRKFSLKTILLIVDQALSRIRFLHSKGYVHRDIKPSNFLMTTGKHGNVLYLIDFGIAKNFSEAELCKDVEDPQQPGTWMYATINHHNRREQSWQDDLEALGYTLVHLASGSLPWLSLPPDNTREERKELVKEMKERLSGEELCDGVLPQEFATYINYVRGLTFGDKPDYAYLQRLFRNLFKAQGFKYDHIYDWTQKLFDEMQAEMDNEGADMHNDGAEMGNESQAMGNEGVAMDNQGAAMANEKW
ncbi:kinase-like domain-containing protein [Chaetomium sp. MPI-SDFR-AT-0129]|nr:kinase-like domain-containing protein [Chaetomium sp. MPI-SDFR-AT-0129]